MSDKYHLDELQLKIKGKRRLLWRAVDKHGVMLDILIQQRRDQCTAETFWRRVLAVAGAEPRVVITEKPASYPPALRRVLPETEQRRHKGSTIERRIHTSRRVNARRQLLAERRRMWREVVGLPPVA